MGRFSRNFFPIAVFTPLMKTTILPKHFLSLIAAGVMPLAVCTVSVAQESTETNQPIAAADSSAVTSQLNQAYTNLAQADHDYDGHRAKAMGCIRWVITKLGGSVTTNGKGGENQTTSDEQLHAAQAILQQVQPQLRGSLLLHINRANEEIDTALSIR